MPKHVACNKADINLALTDILYFLSAWRKSNLRLSLF